MGEIEIDLDKVTPNDKTNVHHYLADPDNTHLCEYIGERQRFEIDNASFKLRMTNSSMFVFSCKITNTKTAKTYQLNSWNYQEIDDSAKGMFNRIFLNKNEDKDKENTLIVKYEANELVETNNIFYYKINRMELTSVVGSYVIEMITRYPDFCYLCRHEKEDECYRNNEEYKIKTQN